MIANARYEIFDLSARYDDERKEWVIPRNLLIELGIGIAIALNNLVLFLRTVENRAWECPLPGCVSGIGSIIELIRESILKRVR